jgi:hypothetical protein
MRKGTHHSKKTKELLSKIQKGKKKYEMTDEIRKKISKNHARPMLGRKGEKITQWKGDDASYSAKHTWIESIKGKPRKCEDCGTEKAKKFEWANIDHKYSRNPDDYIRLCHKCHIKLDKALGSIVQKRDKKIINN